MCNMCRRNALFRAVALQLLAKKVFIFILLSHDIKLSAARHFKDCAFLQHQRKMFLGFKLEFIWVSFRLLGEHSGG